MHAGLWASLLGPPLPENDKGKVLGAVVELTNNLQGALGAFAGRSACIVSFDANKQCYMACVEKNLFPVERSQIKRILCHHSDAETGTDAWSGWQANNQREIRRGHERQRRKLFDKNWGPGPGQAPVLRGIPDGAFHFQLLFELVGKEAQKRLEATRDELADRADRQKQYAPTEAVDYLSQHGGRLLTAMHMTNSVSQVCMVSDVISQHCGESHSSRLLQWKSMVSSYCEL